ncbi:N-acetylmuramoyl-L-alanine amidase [Montanilutibacter psychrotolerans]|nr:N-acetylmuramoyl-L-alanine amidase [Lysobacter psychrotolerans]
MNPLRLALVSLLSAGLVACTTAPLRNPMAQWQGSSNFDARRARAVVLHHTSMDSVDEALRTLKSVNSGGPVSAHYLIGEDGRVLQLVAEDARAWHAGGSRWAGIDDLNSSSIGIELDNDGSEPFSEAQLQSLLRLLADISARLRIQPRFVIGHGDIAPTRKDDPSTQFPWQRLAQAGFGLWPRDAPAPPPAGFDPWLAMAVIGYDLRDPTAAMRAFHRHYRGSSAETWQPGDFEILHDLQSQVLELPATR